MYRFSSLPAGSLWSRQDATFFRVLLFSVWLFDDDRLWCAPLDPRWQTKVTLPMEAGVLRALGDVWHSQVRKGGGDKCRSKRESVSAGGAGGGGRGEGGM